MIKALGTTCLVALSTLLVAAAPAKPAPAPKSTPAPIRNIVLVHGAWADGSGWRGVYDILRKDGYTVRVVANPDASLADDVAATRRTVALMDGPVILVGHSYGGAIITDAGNDPKVAGLVYIAALVPENDEPLFKFLTAAAPVTASADGFLFLNRDAFLAAFAPDVPQADREFMADSQVPVAAANGGATIKQAAWHTKPSWYLVSRDDLIIPPDVERMYAKRAGATTEETAGSHVAFVAHPQQTAALIEKAAIGAAK
ncbi:MAG: alpha/beta hydrolase [Sphingomonas sp.]